MKNKFVLLGLLGLLGFLGFIEENDICFSFFGFLSFFSYWNVPGDELFMQNLKNSASISFSIFVLGNIFTIILSVVKAHEVLIVAYPIIFALTLIVFMFSLFYYEKLEKEN